ncbi:MAG: hypothetical protein KatS3mg097_121 [Candidatus Parcubacteria bacterium]|nr:MAG: hypothetical protein KatS3mg097_121 [Candidatus Parcubacteria bacterium]
MPKNRDNQKGINLDTAIRAIWGGVLTEISDYIGDKSGKIAEQLISNPKARRIIANIIGGGAQIFEKGFKGVQFEIIADILEQVARGVKAGAKKTKAEESIESATLELEELEIIAASKNTEVKRTFLLRFSPSKHHEFIKSFTAEEIDEYINVLINLERLRKELAKSGVEIDLKAIWEIIKDAFQKISKTTGKGLEEIINLIKENYPKIRDKYKELDRNLAEKLRNIRNNKNKWRLI